MVMSEVFEIILHTVTDFIGVHGAQLGLVAILLVVALEGKRAHHHAAVFGRSAGSLWWWLILLAVLAFGGGVTVHTDVILSWVNDLGQILGGLI